MMRIANLFLPPIIALTLLTRLPVWRLLPRVLKNSEWSEQQRGLSVLWYPAVGALLALLLYGFSVIAASLPVILLAALLLTLWIILTGALHLDGFADSIDAAYAAHRYSDKEKILGVFKDPTSGSMAVVGLVLLLLVKFSVLVILLGHPSSLLLILLITLPVARLSAVLMIMTTPYVGEGLALTLKHYFPQKLTLVLTFLMWAMLFFFLPWVQAAIIVCIIATLLYLWRRFWMQKIGGFVGDCVGAVIEIIEVAVLMVML